MTGELILVVEDEGLIALHLTEMLEEASYRVSGPVSAGETVLQEIGSSELPALILMDIALAGKLDGIRTAQQIRDRYPIPVIFLTAYSNQYQIDRAKEISSDGYLMKPVMHDELLKAIRNALDRKGSTPHLAPGS
ncbi:MAG TPA: response regulator [Methanoregula sp.]|nr:response regulator [Methanoregula sp.]